MSRKRSQAYIDGYIITMDKWTEQGWEKHKENAEENLRGMRMNMGQRVQRLLKR